MVVLDMKYGISYMCIWICGESRCVSVLLSINSYWQGNCFRKGMTKPFKRTWYNVTDENGEYYPEFVFVNRIVDRKCVTNVHYVELGATI